MRIKRMTLILIALLFLGSSVLAMDSANYSLDWFTPLTSGGGGSATSANFATNLTVGQTAIGASASTNYAVGLGYWYGVEMKAPRGANLSVTKSDSPDPVVAGGTLTYTLVVLNSGPGDATGVVMTDTLPAGVTYVSASPGCSHAAGRVVCPLGDLARSVDVTVEIVVTAPGAPDTLDNTATVSCEQEDPDTANNTAVESTTVVEAEADLSVAKLDSPDPLSPGGALTYTLTVHNDGPVGASGVVLTDALPAGVTYISAAPSQGSCSGTSQVVCTLGDLASGADATVVIVVTAPGVAGMINNTATVLGDQVDPDASNNTDAEDTTVAVLPEADLSLTKTGSPDPVLAGSTLTYTLVVANGGPDDASNVVLTDSLPISVTYGSAAPSQGSCSESAGTVVCDLGAMTSGADATVLIVVTAPEVAGLLGNQAVVCSDLDDPEPSDNTVTASTQVAGADLVVSKSDSPDPVLVGETLTYTLSVVNDGPFDATGVVLTDTLPGSATYASATPSQGSCSESGGTVVCDLGDLASGGNAMAVVVVTAPASGGVLDNTATALGDQADPDAGNNTATSSTTVATADSADLVVTKTGLPDPVAPGGALTYTVDVANNGPADASGVTLTDTLPAGVTYESATPSQGSCGETAGAVVCDLGALTSSGSASIEIVVTAPGAAGPIDNTATAGGAETDYNTANNTDVESTTVVEPGADLSVTKTDLPDPVAAGGRLTYTLSVANDGPAHASGVTLTDTLPAGATFNSASAGCNHTAGVVVCQLGAMSSGSVTQVEIVVTAPGTGGTIANSASVSGNQTDPNTANNTDTEDTLVTAVEADLSVGKTDSPDPVLAGSTLTYTLNVANDGPVDATGVVLTDTLPAGVMVVSATPSQGSCSQAGGTVTCNLGALANGANATAVVVVTAPAAGGSIDNTATALGDQADPNVANNTSTASTTVLGIDWTELVVSKADSPDPVAVGETLTYTVEVINNGPGDATGLMLTDTLPAGVAFVSVTPSQGSCGQAGGTITCTLGSLNNGASATAVVVVTAPAATGMIDNVASVSGEQTDPNAINNEITESTTVAAADATELVVVKADSPDPVATGGALTYAITVTNNGPGDATGVVLTDTLPAGVTYGSVTPSQGGCSESAGTVVCDLGGLARNAHATVAIAVTAPGTAGLINNTATLSGDQDDPATGNNTTVESTTVAEPNVDLSVTKTDSPDPVMAGGRLTYTISVTNAGQFDASGVVLTDTLPTGVTFVSASAGCAHAAGVVACSVGNLANGANATLEIVVTAPASTGTLNNEVEVGGDQDDLNPANDADVESTTVNVPSGADLSVTKTDSPDPVLAGSALTYTLVVTNSGPDDASGVVLTDTLPTGVTFVSASAGCAHAAGVVICSVGNLTNGADATVLIAVTSPGTAGSIDNTVAALSDQPDPVMANNTDLESTTVNVPSGADLSVTKTDSPDPVLAGGTLTYTLVVANAGPANASGVVLTDTLPAGVTHVSTTPSQGSCSGTSTVVCGLGNLANGVNATVVIVVTVPANGSLNNTASVSSNQIDPNSANNTATATTTIEAAPQYRIFLPVVLKNL